MHSNMNEHVSFVEIPEEYEIQLKRQGFILGKVLGQGSSGSVYEAEQPSLGRKVAVKFFDSAFVRDNNPMRKRFSRESRILAKLQHQGLPYVLTKGIVNAPHGETPYFVMEYIEGKSIREILNEKHKLSLDTSIEYVQQILDALGYAHARDIVHRDVKPENILVDSRNRCFLIDFSIGVSLQHEVGLTRATSVGEKIGTYSYMAPEQLTDSSKVDARTDIFSMGVVLLELLSGRSDRTNMSRSLTHLPHSVVSCIETACAPDQDDRFQSAEDFIRVLGGRRQISAALLIQPALAICTNSKCPGADWSPQGYYRGPNIIENSSESYCTACGGKLKYRCGKCGAGIVNAPYCWHCGEKIFSLPLCEKCGSYLKLEDMKKDTSNGCEKCNRNQQTVSSASGEFDNDIPF